MFRSESDRRRFDELIGRASDALDVTVLAFCWMTNHVHLAVRVEQEPLGRFVHRFASQFARYLNWRRKSTGHVFEGRYFASLVSVDEYLLQLARYIDLNPVKAGIIEDPADYAWCSHRCYLGAPGPEWLSRDLILSLFSDHRAVAARRYRQFVLQDGNSELGDPFSWRPTLESGTSSCLDELVDQICELYSVDRKEITGASKNRTLSSIRMRIIEEAVDTHGAGFAEIGRCLNRSGVAIGGLYRRRKKSK